MAGRVGFRNLLILGVFGIVCFDAVASILALVTRYDYATAAIGSIAIYFLLGWFAYKHGGLGKSVLSGVVVGFAEFALGWPISAAIGPGAIPDGQFSIGLIVVSGVFVIVLGILFGLLGGVAARFAGKPIDQETRIK